LSIVIEIKNSISLWTPTTFNLPKMYFIMNSFFSKKNVEVLSNFDKYIIAPYLCTCEFFHSLSPFIWNCIWILYL